MATIVESPKAFGGPGMPPRWTHSAKDVVGTAYSTSSRVWFTASDGVISEVYYPTIDRPQVRDLQYLVTDGKTFVHDAHRSMRSTTEYLADSGLAARIVNADPGGRYRLVMEVIADPHGSCVLIDTRLEGEPGFVEDLRLYALLAPHLDVGGWGNNGNVARIVGREFLTAHKGGVWLALAANVPFRRRSCGYVGSTDGWRDLHDNLRLDYEFAAAENGNIALTGEIELPEDRRFTLALAFGHTLHRAVTTLFQSLGIPFEQHYDRFREQWHRACSHFLPLGEHTGDDARLYEKSYALLLAHEDKGYPGAMIASLSIPWGEAKGDEDLGGYHLVWTRDMVNSVTGLMAAGDTVTPVRALVYLICSQQPDGGFPQNFWIDGSPYWTGIQLDEIAFPVMLAWRLQRAGALGNCDPYPMVLKAARYMVAHGPVTPQERWEENSGLSPSTLASNIAGLLCAAHLARERGDLAAADLLLDYADFLESHIEAWTVTNQGTLVKGIRRHYIRINPQDPDSPEPDEDPDHGAVLIHNRPPGARAEFPASEIVDAGFLELVRYGIRRPGDPLIEDSLKVVDAALRVDFPAGPCWRRYPHDGYGQRDDGGPYQGWGRGRPWPLLTGERGHYELAAGRDARPYLRAMERFANAAGLLPEQIWDGPDRPEKLLSRGGPTGSAMPLMWAHAEYLKLVRSVADGQVYDLIPEVAERYQNGPERRPIEVWKSNNRRLREITPGTRLRVQAGAPYVLHWTKDEWRTVTDTNSTATTLGIHFVDLPTAPGDRAPIRFTFLWIDDGHWEGRDFAVAMKAG